MTRSSLGLAIVLAFAAPAFAFEASSPVSDSVNVVETLKVLHDETDPSPNAQFWAVINRLNLTDVKDRFAAGIRYDSEFYFESEQYRLKYWLEKAFVQYENEGLYFRAGDSYARMGNGLALSVVKRDEFGLDNTIRGGIWQLGDPGGYVTARALVGLVNEGDDLRFTPPRASRDEPAPDEQDQLHGGELVAGVPGWGFIEGRALAGVLRYDPSTGFPMFEEDDEFKLAALGARWLNFGGHGQFAGEYAWYELADRKSPIPDENIEGRAGYASLNLHAGRVTFVAEGQDYFRFSFPYAEPPILEFEKQTFGHLPDREDLLGARGLVEVQVPVIETGVFANYYHAKRHTIAPADLDAHYADKDSEDWVWHGSGGFEKDFEHGARIEGSGGYRDEPEGRWVHGELDASTPLLASHAIELAARWKDFHGMEIFAGTDYGAWSVAPSWNWNPYLSLTGRYERSDEPLAGGTGAEGLTTDDDPDFWSGEATVHAGSHVDLRLFYGRIKGGLVCSGGVCRNVPPFEGFQSDLTLRF